MTRAKQREFGIAAPLGHCQPPAMPALTLALGGAEKSAQMSFLEAWNHAGPRALALMTGSDICPPPDLPPDGAGRGILSVQ